MKSAYELAMERLEKNSPSDGPLNEQQKAELANIDRVYDAKIAEREVFLNGAKAKEPDHAEREKIDQQLRSEKAKINVERETKKDKVRAS